MNEIDIKRIFVQIIILWSIVVFWDISFAQNKRGSSISVYDNFYDVAVVSPQEVWIAGHEGKIFHTTDAGKSWQRQKSHTDLSLFSISFGSKQTGFITGAEGIILITEDGGKNWQRKSSGTDQHLLSGCYADAQNLWVVGERGTIIHSMDRGATWRDRSLGEDVILNKVYFFDNLHGWIVGEFGKIFHTRDAGRTWQLQSNLIGIPKDETLGAHVYPIYLYDVGFIDLKKGWVIGAAGTILYTEDGGQNWRKISLPVDQSLFSLGKGKEVLAVGSVGTLISNHTNPDNNQWRLRKDIMVFSWLRGIDFCQENYGWIVGGSGTVLKTTDGGRQWEVIPTGR